MINICLNFTRDLSETQLNSYILSYFNCKFYLFLNNTFEYQRLQAIIHICIFFDQQFLLKYISHPIVLRLQSLIGFSSLEPNINNSWSQLLFIETLLYTSLFTKYTLVLVFRTAHSGSEKLKWKGCWVFYPYYFLNSKMYSIVVSSQKTWLWMPFHLK